MSTRIAEGGNSRKAGLPRGGFAGSGLILEAAEVWAETEALDTNLKGGAVTAEEMFEEGFEAARAGDELIDLFDLATSQLFPAGADGSVLAEAAEEEFDFSERKIHFTGETNQQQVVEGGTCVAALAPDALGWREQTYFFVIANGRRRDGSAYGQVSDFQFRGSPSGE
jgi:hypothetical protein